MSVADSQLTTATRTDSDQAIDANAWLNDHGDVLFRFAYLRVGDTHIAEDLVQETLVNALASFDRFRHESSVRTWLFVILRNEISRYFRKRKKQQPGDNSELMRLDRLLHPDIGNKSFASATERDEFWEMIQSCYEKLPDHLLEVFLARLADPNEKIEDLASKFGIKESNVSVRLFRARLLLRRCVEQTWSSEA